ncbi:MAG: hypothetical protein AAF653_08330 [Chloroflexota bacterium]
MKTNMQRKPEHLAVTVAPAAGQVVPASLVLAYLAQALQGQHITTETTFTVSGDGVVVAKNDNGVALVAPALPTKV